MAEDDGAARFTVWVCRGRMCTANGSAAVLDAAVSALRARPDDVRARVVLARGGCFGLCEIGPTVVVRRYAAGQPLPSLDEDRLSLTGRDNEIVYCAITPGEIGGVLDAHLDRDAPCAALTRAAREASIPPPSPVAAKIRALRARRLADAPLAGPPDTPSNDEG